MARRPRLHVDQALAGGDVRLTSAQARRLRTVLRRGVGDELRLFNAGSGEWATTLLVVDKSGGLGRLDAQIRSPSPEPGPVLLFAPLKGGRTELIVEKATELGAARLQPIGFRHGVVDRVNADRLAAVAVEAAEQCARLSVPEIAPMIGLDAALAAWPAERRLFACVERGDATAMPAAADGDGLLIGPEGGFAPEERMRLAAAPFVAYASLGPRILRAETAAMAALAAAAALSGAWSSRPPNA